VAFQITYFKTHKGQQCWNYVNVANIQEILLHNKAGREVQFKRQKQKKNCYIFSSFVFLLLHFFYISFLLFVCLLSSSFFLFLSLFDLFFLSCHAVKMVTSLQLLKHSLKLFITSPSAKLTEAHLVKQFPFVL